MKKNNIIATKKANIEKVINKSVKKEVEKINQNDLVEKAARQKSMALMRANIYNTNTNPGRKPMSDVPFEYLRRMSILYPIARACINRRIRQMTQLEWNITTIDEIKDEAGYEDQIKQIKQFFKKPLGVKSRFRKLINIAAEDILVLDAIAFEYQTTYKGDLISLVPVDPTTIALRVNKNGLTPEPPEVAYTQIIAGQKIADFTIDEMLYESMSNRSNSPYGMAPLESLVIQVESALRGSLYNLNYLRENNIPEGFITLPEDMAQSNDDIREWQLWWDALLSGDQRMVHRLKVIPGGSEYTPAKKPEDMAFERFELWLLQQTCAVFDVPPQEIGITYQVNKSTADSQSNIAKEKGLLPLANFFKEIFDELIQEKMGYENLQFEWVNINPVDRKEEVEIAQKEVEMGALSVDEYRIEQGREPIGLGHYVRSSGGVTLIQDIGKDNVDTPTRESNQNQVDAEEEEKKALRAWRKAIYNDLDNNRELRSRFPSEFISPETRKLIQAGIGYITSKADAKKLFDQFLDNEVRSSYRLLKLADQIEQIQKAKFQ